MKRFQDYSHWTLLRIGAFSVIASGLLIAGALNAISAHDFAEHYVAGTSLSSYIRIVGWPSPVVFGVCALGVASALLAGWLFLGGKRLQGRLVAVLTGVVAVALWYDTHVVSTIKGIAENVGTNYPWGEPASEVNRAGLLFVLCILLALGTIRWAPDRPSESDAGTIAFPVPPSLPGAFIGH